MDLWAFAVANRCYDKSCEPWWTCPCLHSGGVALMSELLDSHTATLWAESRGLCLHRAHTEVWIQSFLRSIKHTQLEPQGIGRRREAGGRPADVSLDIFWRYFENVFFTICKKNDLFWTTKSRRSSLSYHCFLTLIRSSCHLSCQFSSRFSVSQLSHPFPVLFPLFPSSPWDPTRLDHKLDLSSSRIL